MTFTFSKMHGAGNGFVVVRDAENRFPDADAAFVRALCAPKTGLDSEGLLLLRDDPEDGMAFRMVFLNPDGSRAAMCGNGARCAAFFAFAHGFAPASMRFRTDAGILEAVIERATPTEAFVRVRTSEPSGRRPHVKVAASAREFFFVDSGVPHAVAVVPDLTAVDIATEGRAVRFDPAFAPAGTNVDFVRITGPSSIALRTYERGVEAETAACGTGAVASAVAVVEKGLCHPPVRVAVASGVELEVDFESASCTSCARPSLAGPARFVCTGTFDEASFR